MRTTLAIDDDVLMAAKRLAARDKRSVGQVITVLARKGLSSDVAPPLYRNGILLMPVRPGAGVATLEMVNQLRDEE